MFHVPLRLESIPIAVVALVALGCQGPDGPSSTLACEQDPFSDPVYRVLDDSNAGAPGNWNVGGSTFSILVYGDHAELVDLSSDVPEHTNIEIGAGTADDLLITRWGDGFAAVWRGEFSLEFTHFDVDGVPHTQSTLPVHNRNRPEALVLSGDELALVYTNDDPLSNNRTRMLTLDADGQPTRPPRLIHPEAVDDISIAWNGSEWGVLQVVQNMERTLAFTTLGDTGVGTTPVEVASLGGNPTLLWAEDRWLAVYHSEAVIGQFDVFLRELEPQMLEPQRLTDGTGTSVLPDAVWTGSEIGVVWQENASQRIGFERFMTNGASMGEVVYIEAPGGGEAYTPNISWADGRYAMGLLALEDDTTWSSVHVDQGICL